MSLTCSDNKVWCCPRISFFWLKTCHYFSLKSLFKGSNTMWVLKRKIVCNLVCYLQNIVISYLLKSLLASLCTTGPWKLAVSVTTVAWICVCVLWECNLDRHADCCEEVCKPHNFGISLCSDPCRLRLCSVTKAKNSQGVSWRSCVLKALRAQSSFRNSLWDGEVAA